MRRTFDRILVHGLIEAPATRLIEMLNPDGALVAVMIDEAAASSASSASRATPTARSPRARTDPARTLRASLVARG